MRLIVYKGIRMKKIRVFLKSSTKVLTFNADVESEGRYNNYLRLYTREEGEVNIHNCYSKSKSKWSPRDDWDLKAVIPQKSIKYILCD